MKELLQSLDWNTLLSTTWTVVMLPVLAFIGNEIRKYAQTKRIDKYTDILQNNVVDAVKDVYETIVKDIKGSDQWTPEKQNEVKEIAKTKAVQALSKTIYDSLRTANEDFENYLDSLVGTALFDIKNGKK